MMNDINRKSFVNRLISLTNHLSFFKLSLNDFIHQESIMYQIFVKKVSSEEELLLVQERNTLFSFDFVQMPAPLTE